MDLKVIEENVRHYEFLAINSKEIIEKLVDSYRQQYLYGGTIISLVVLFILFFFNNLDESNQIIQIISILPVTLFISSMLLMVSIFQGKPLDQALSVKKYKELLNKTYKEFLRYEIESNKDSYIKNAIITIKQNRRYMQSIF